LAGSKQARVAPIPRTTPQMKAIETHIYRRRFRSRLEARWAVFFTSIGLRWEYEPEGFNLDGEAYLPDFRVWTPQGQPMWFEIKPGHITSDEKFDKFHAALKSVIDPESCESPRCMLLAGDPCHFMQSKYICPRCGLFLDKQWQHIYYGSNSYFYCWHCDYETPQGGGNPECSDGVQGIKYTPHKGDIDISEPELQRLLGLTENAITAAMSARFEHGEARNYRC
jgi:hypothetical protein